MALPKNTSIPKSSGQFMKLENGNNKFRVLSDVVIGWEGWKDGKPFRHEGDTCQIKPHQVDTDQMSGKPKINYFWAMSVWNYQDEKVQVLQLTQKTVMGPLFDLEENEDWGDLKDYDVTVTKTKEGDRTKYSVMPSPKKQVSKEIAEAYAEAKPDLSKLFAGEYPIAEKEDGGVIGNDSVPF